MTIPDFEAPYYRYKDYVIHKALLLYVPPVLLVVGTFGNVFSFCVLIENLKKASTYTYFSALAIADLLVLYVGLLRIWVGQLSVDIEDESDFLCKLMIFLGYFTSHVSVWLIVAVTMERAIVVSFPLHVPRICNIRYARSLIVCLFVVFVGINVHFFWTVKLSYIQFNETTLAKCHAAPNHIELNEVYWPWIDAILYSFLPFTLILILNAMIIKNVIMARRNRNALQQQYVLTTRNRSIPARRSQCEKSRKITIMLLAVSFTFIFTTLPMNSLLIYKSVFIVDDDDEKFARMKLLYTIAELLMYSNHSVNFFLYCATGRKFRDQFVALFSRCLSGKMCMRKRRKTFRYSVGSFKIFKMNSSGSPKTGLDDDMVYDPYTVKGTAV